MNDKPDKYVGENSLQLVLNKMMSEYNDIHGKIDALSDKMNKETVINPDVKSDIINGVTESIQDMFDGLLDKAY